MLATPDLTFGDMTSYSQMALIKRKRMLIKICVAFFLRFVKWIWSWSANSWALSQQSDFLHWDRKQFAFNIQVAHNIYSYPFCIAMNLSTAVRGVWEWYPFCWQLDQSSRGHIIIYYNFCSSGWHGLACQCSLLLRSSIAQKTCKSYVLLTHSNYKQKDHK